MSRIRTFTKELFRRKVVRLVGAYLGIFLSVAIGLSSLLDPLGIPDFAFRVFMAVGVTAIPLVAFLAWKYDFVPPQLVRDIKDLETVNPGLSLARVRHDTKDAGYLLLSWTSSDGSTSEKRYFQPVAIGRDPANDIEFSDDRVSRYHAVLWAEDGVWQIRDLDSANGTFIGHSRVTGSSQIPQTCDLRFHVNGPIVNVHVAKAAETRVG
jgi:hypothetical protein